MLTFLPVNSRKYYTSRRNSTGVYFTGLYAGFSLSLALGTLADNVVGWKWAYWLAALGGFAVAALAFWTIPEPTPLVRPDAIEDTGFSSDGEGVTAAVAVEEGSRCVGRGATRGEGGGGGGGGRGGGASAERM